MKKEPVGPGKEAEMQQSEQPESESRYVDKVVFAKEERGKGGIPIYKSSGGGTTGRKMIVLENPPVPPELGKSYRVRIIKDTNPEEAEKGKLIVEIAMESEKELEIIIKAEEVSAVFATNDFKKALELLRVLKKDAAA